MSACPHHEIRTVPNRHLDVVADIPLATIGKRNRVVVGLIPRDLSEEIIKLARAAESTPAGEAGNGQHSVKDTGLSPFDGGSHAFRLRRHSRQCHITWLIGLDAVDGDVARRCSARHILDERLQVLSMCEKRRILQHQNRVLDSRLFLLGEFPSRRRSKAATHEQEDLASGHGSERLHDRLQHGDAILRALLEALAAVTTAKKSIRKLFADEVFHRRDSGDIATEGFSVADAHHLFGERFDHVQCASFVGREKQRHVLDRRRRDDHDFVVGSHGLEQSGELIEQILARLCVERCLVEEEDQAPRLPAARVAGRRQGHLYELVRLGVDQKVRDCLRNSILTNDEVLFLQTGDQLAASRLHDNVEVVQTNFDRLSKLRERGLSQRCQPQADRQKHRGDPHSVSPQLPPPRSATTSNV
jgi:hypothetical protein